MRFLFLESYYGGSHREFADGLCEYSRHNIDLVTMADRFWKWRMRGAAFYFARKIPDPEVYDGLIVTSLLSLGELRGIWGHRCPPALVYFHENQMTYPVPHGQKRDFSFGFTNISTALAADRILINSRFHLTEFLAGVQDLVRQMPDYRPKWIAEALLTRTDVLYPGCRLGDIPPREQKPASPPLIIWNHRWEFDKNPDAFFQALDVVREAGIEFRLALMGENFQVVPKPFLDARDRYGDRIVQYGYAESREDYLRWLARGDVVVSTAIQENFGISVVEAVAAGCWPVLPRRLAYPEVIPERFHHGCLYNNQKELESRLMEILRAPAVDPSLTAAMDRYSWGNLISRYDQELESLAHGSGPKK